MGGPLVLVIRTTQPDGRVCFWPNSDVEICLTIRSLSDVERTWRSLRPLNLLRQPGLRSQSSGLKG